MNKSITIVMVLFLSFSCLLTFERASVSAATPTVPEFKLSYTNRVYDEPAATSQWSGEVTWPGSHTEVREVTIKVLNQPHNDYINGDVNGAKEKLYYNVRVKSHSSNEWTELWGQTNFWGSNGTIISGVTYQGASASEVTYISFNFNGPNNLLHTSSEVALGSEVDFQVKALIGYLDCYKCTFSGQESPWSPTQSLTVLVGAQATSSPTPDAANPTVAAQQSTDISTALYRTNDFTSVSLSVFTAIIGIFVAIIAALLVFYRRPKQSPNTH